MVIAVKVKLGNVMSFRVRQQIFCSAISNEHDGCRLQARRRHRLKRLSQPGRHSTRNSVQVKSGAEIMLRAIKWGIFNCRNVQRGSEAGQSINVSCRGMRHRQASDGHRGGRWCCCCVTMSDCEACVPLEFLGLNGVVGAEGRVVGTARSLGVVL